MNRHYSLKTVSCTLLAFVVLSALPVRGQSLDDVFLNPPQEARPLMIWQWMDGVVSREGITADLEAYREAGLGGVQQFMVGGPLQGLICDTANAIGTRQWQQLMRHAVSECRRLGLSFGTHNCPGWSSSAFPTVEPQYSMQKLVWTDTLLRLTPKSSLLALPRQPAVDPRWNYYEDIAVLAMPADSTVALADIRVLSPEDFPLAPRGLPASLRLLRVGHTTNGKTNDGTAPSGGVGLECDKMSREAVARYWDSYPQMLISLAGDAVGTTFQRIEIDSYEAGGQEWTRLLPQQFSQRCGYDLLPWTAALCGLTVESAEATKRFRSDYARVGQQLFAENYYAYMAELAHRHGLKLLYQPYGTNSSKPFNPINTEAIARLLPDDYFCTEFWTKPNWGWPQLPRHTLTAHRLGLQRIFAEGFTCWPLDPWQEDPASQKVLADRAFCFGVNSLMLHAGAQNPWPGAVPGMTFGKWGSWWTPGQTWWRSGGARLFFQYLTRCQALLQRGQWVDDYTSKSPSLQVLNGQTLQWVHRRDGDADIYFLSNPKDSAFTAEVLIASDRRPELWLPETGERRGSVWFGLAGNGDDRLRVPLHFDEHQSCFIVLREPRGQLPAVRPSAAVASREELPLRGPWTLSFPEGWDAPAAVVLDSLLPWNEHSIDGIRYFSGTATYTATFRLKRIRRNARYELDLGQVKNLAQVSINGQPVAHLWKKPFRCDITPYVTKGDNQLQIAVTNLWPNRMIGDEQWPDDVEWDQPFVYDYAPGRPVAGCFMKEVPQWLAQGLPRPEQHRKAVVTFKYFRADSPLLPSGLLGPVTVHIIHAE